VLGEGEFFGEMALIDDEAPTRPTYAMEDSALNRAAPEGLTGHPDPRSRADRRSAPQGSCRAG